MKRPRRTFLRLAAGSAALKVTVWIAARAFLVRFFQRKQTSPPAFSSPHVSTPMRRTRLACCACAASGHYRRAAEPSDEFSPLKANAHLALLCLRGKKIARPSL